MASAKAKIRHVFGDTFSCRAAPPDILVKLSDVNVDASQADRALNWTTRITKIYHQLVGYLCFYTYTL